VGSQSSSSRPGDGPLRAVQPDDDRLANCLVVDPETGQAVGTYGDLTRRLTDQLTGAERDVRTWRARHADLKRDKEAEAEESPVWPAAISVFDYWRERTGHLGAEWTLDRFELIRPHLERSNTGRGRRATKLTPDLISRNVEICKLAIDGIVFDPFVTTGANGRPLVHDDLHLVFGKSRQGASYFEKRCKLAPVERIQEVFGRREESKDGDNRESSADPRAATGTPGRSQQGSLLESGGETRPGSAAA